MSIVKSDPILTFRILLVTSYLGYGHRKAAEAIVSALGRLYPGVESKIVDFWTFLSDGVRQDIQNFYLKLISEHSEVYNKLYHLDVKEWQKILSGQKSLTEVSFLMDAVCHMFDLPLNKILSLNQEMRERFFIKMVIKRLTTPLQFKDGWMSDSTKWLLKKILHQRVKETIKNFNPDVIVTTQVWPSFLLSFLKSYGKPSFKVPLVSVITDYGVNAFWTAAQATDLFFVSSEEMAYTIVQKGFSIDKVRVTGIPVGTEFFTLPSKKDALLSLPLDPSLPTLLIMGGGLGVGMDAVVDMMEEISNIKCNAIIITGENLKLYDRLSSLKISPTRNIKLFNRVENMVIPLVASDIVLSKPGGLTVAETLAVGRPMFIPFYIGGQERYNVEYIEKHGLGIVLKDKHSFTEIIRKYVSDPDALIKWQEHVKGFGYPKASLFIAHDLINLL
jgi:processive 1,2-diacylglycerol beta-glucosyltransferase